MPKQIALPMGDDDDQELDPLANDTLNVDADDPQNGALRALLSSSGKSTPVSSDTASSTPVSLMREFDASLLALSKVRGVGLKTLRALYEHFTDLSQIWRSDVGSLADLLHQLRVKGARTIATTIIEQQDLLFTEAQRTLHRLRSDSITILARHDPAFPKRLAEIPDGPHWIFVEGSVDVLGKPLIGIVGTRRPSSIGVQAAERLAAIICREGFGIVSGLAEGIDAAAHRVGLYYQAPQVAILGTGIDIVFPASTAGIRQRIVETGGAVITEYLPGDNYSRANFVQRNRIQSALSIALCPVESQEQSGTIHTLRFAAQYGRPVFGVVRGEPAPQNDIVRMLRAAGNPVFDLEARERRPEFIQWLRSVVPPEEWPAERRQVNGHWFFEDLLRLVDDIIADVPLRPEDLTWFQEQVEKRADTVRESPQQKNRQKGGE